MEIELKESITKFLDAFYQVFDKDWAYTKECLGIIGESEEQKRNSREVGLEAIYFISPNGTFIHPKVEDEVEDWGYRSALLDEYRNLKNLLSK